MKTIKFLFISILTMAFISCDKDNVDEVFVTPANESAQAVDGSDGTNGSDGTDGSDGEQGDQREIGDRGEQGEQGEQGAQGETGAQGPAGADGEDGQDGNVNVIASDWLEPLESSYGINNPRHKSLTLENNIDANVITNGVILVYYDSDVNVRLLPSYSLSSTTGDISKSIDSHINHASRSIYVTLRKYNSDFTPREYIWDSSLAIYNRGVRFRYVIIPSGTTGKSIGVNFEKMSYEEVIDYFELDY